MACRHCAAEDNRDFSAEVCLHFPGLAGLSKDPVFVFPRAWFACHADSRSSQFPRVDCGCSPRVVRRKPVPTKVRGELSSSGLIGQGNDCKCATHIILIPKRY